MHPSPARLPSRRAVLGLGVVGTGLMLGGCGLRLDVPPAVPEPDALDSLRNDVARILSKHDENYMPPQVADALKGNPDTGKHSCMPFKAVDKTVAAS